VFISWRLDAVTASTGHAARANARVYVPWSRHEIKSVISRSAALRLFVEQTDHGTVCEAGGVLLNIHFVIYLILFCLCIFQIYARKYFCPLPCIENNPNFLFCLAVILLCSRGW
jgi:hypothetical protein